MSFTTFFVNSEASYLVISEKELVSEEISKLSWAFKAEKLDQKALAGNYIGPRPEMITPWSTNATEIALNMGIKSIKRIESFNKVENINTATFDPMLEALYKGLDQASLEISGKAQSDKEVSDIEAENKEQGLALSAEEIEFLKKKSKELNRNFTDSEIYGFAQINSEHCRHKIFNGKFIIDGQEQEKSLFQLIKDTAKKSPDNLVSAYKDNVAFIKGGKIKEFAPETVDKADYFKEQEIEAVISLKAETHNFPTTVEPFYGASTGSGGEIRDRMAGGTGSIPLIGAAVYMTAYSRISGARSENWEKHSKARNWKYQTPQQILTKASNGASDFGNKFGQPLIVGSLLTFEQKTSRGFYGFDRVIMLAGGVGYGNLNYAQKKEAKVGDKIVLLGGENYRIGMAGSSVSSVDTGKYSSKLELNAVQRANPEMQKRAYNVIRALAERTTNPIKLIHDHGAGGHMNCFSELVEPLGGIIEIKELPLGDPTLSTKEILCNESQERMGLIVAAKDLPLLKAIAERERAPLYVVGEVTGDKELKFKKADGSFAVDLPLEVLFGSAPKLKMEDQTAELELKDLEFEIIDAKQLTEAIKDVLSLEAVACKDWLTNKVDRSVSGRIALQQTCGPLGLPLNNLGLVTLDQEGTSAIATALGHAPVPGLIDEKAGSVLSVAEALTNIVWTPLNEGLKSVALSANWMWPAKQKGEDTRLYRAVEALSDFCQNLGIAVPTGKDSLSMTMNYQDGSTVKAPGTVIVTAVAQSDLFRKVLTPDLKTEVASELLYLDLSGQKHFPLGGSSFAQTLGQLGKDVPNVLDLEKFKKGFSLVQELIKSESLLAGHDVSSGGLISTVLEMAFTGDVGIELYSNGSEKDVVNFLFSEKPAVVLQIAKEKIEAVKAKIKAANLDYLPLAQVGGTQIKLHAGNLSFNESISSLRRVWFKPSHNLDLKQTKADNAKARFENFDRYPLNYIFPDNYQGSYQKLGIEKNRKTKSKIKAAIIRDKGTNGDRELAYAFYLAGFEVKDVTMSDLLNGSETLEDINFLAFPGGFSNSDVLGSAIGWAGTFKYNEKPDNVLKKFYARPDTLSVGVCNGCQLVMALGLIYPEHQEHPQMKHNDSGRFESTFVNVRVQETNNIMLRPLVGTQLGIWIAHGEGRFSFPEKESAYNIPLRFITANYPANPNGSDFNAAAVSSKDGRHLAIMPHLERSLFSWNWPHRKGFKKDDEFSPWMLAFIAARDWVKGNK